jgi:hypothetical protein
MTQDSTSTYTHRVMKVDARCDYTSPGIIARQMMGLTVIVAYLGIQAHGCGSDPRLAKKAKVIDQTQQVARTTPSSLENF